MVYQLSSIAQVCRTIIRNAEQEGYAVTDANVGRLLTANLPNGITWTDISEALVVAGFSDRFPSTIRWTYGS